MTPRPVSRANLPTTPNDACRDLVKRFEGIADGNPKTVNLDPYMDSVGVWTIGWGHALSQNGELLRGEGKRAAAQAMYPAGITMGEAETLLSADLMTGAADVNRWLGERVFPTDSGFTLTNNQHGALCSWFFNLGYKHDTVNSTLLKRVRARKWAEAQAEFPHWRLAGGKVNPGIVIRRACEAAMFGVPDGEDVGAVVESVVARMRAARRGGQ